MSALLQTHELMAGDVVELVSGRSSIDVGRRFIIRSPDRNRTGWLAVHPATKARKRDRRYIGWSGGYAGYEWRLISRADRDRVASRDDR